MYCCYRDTKMEIQGLTDSQNTNYQHGAPLHALFSQQGAAPEIFPHARQTENAISDLSESIGLESDDNNNNRARSSPLRLAENGSLSFQNNCGNKDGFQSADADLGNVIAPKQKAFNELDLLPSGFERADEHDDDLQMAHPLLESCEQSHTPERSPIKPACSSSKNLEELYAVFNILHKDNDNKEREVPLQCKLEDNGFSLSKSKTYDFLSDTDESVSKTSSESVHLSSDSSCNTSERIEQTVRVCLESENQDQMLSVETGSDQTASAAKMTCTTFVQENRVGADETELDFINLAVQESSSNGDIPPDGASLPVHETYSGTIMINNQSIIVTIENGMLTLAAPPEGFAYKDDKILSLKEHLGMKDNEDLVLLNYDGGSKSIGKISNVVSSQQGDPKAGLVSNDLELTLADDCSLSEMGVTMDSCPSIKQEEGAVCTTNDGGIMCQNPQSKKVRSEEELQPINLLAATGLAKKGSVVKYQCPQPGCSSTFDTRQSLKVHLVLHTDDQRPFKCTLEGCGWSFTTSYKLKRHLQSHDKVRPFKCEWENCGRSFTTVYNLKAHVKAHDQENAFACEVCSERFRTATRLANHQRTHFEPERPHKCEFPG